MAQAPSSNPLLIVSIVRYNGVTTLKVSGHGFTAGNVGNAIRITGFPDGTGYNGTFTISKVPDADTIQFLQPTQNDIHVDLRGGAISVG